jgi:hypothetical protein
MVDDLTHGFAEPGVDDVESGGSEAVIEATGLRTFENVAQLIDPVIVTRALDNDSLDEQRRPPPA